MPTAAPEARALWRLVEPYHQLAYRSTEAQTTLAALGLERPDQQYFASRLAAAGPIGTEVAVALLYGFAPHYVGGAVPEVWTRAAPATVTEARFAIADSSLRRALASGTSDPAVVTAATLARRAAGAIDLAGRPMAAAHVALPWPDEPHLVLWHACTILREHRGDAHWAVTATAGLDGCECHVLHGADGHMPADLLQRVTAWTDGEWEAATARLTDRGLLDERGGITDDGQRVKLDLEHLTDQLAMAPLRTLDPADRATLLEALQGPVRQIVEAGMVPTWEVRERLWRDLPSGEDAGGLRDLPVGGR